MTAHAHPPQPLEEPLDANGRGHRADLRTACAATLAPDGLHPR